LLIPTTKSSASDSHHFDLRTALVNHPSHEIHHSFFNQALLSALEARAVKARTGLRAAAVGGGAGQSSYAGGAIGLGWGGGGVLDAAKWVRELVPLLVEKQELISRSGTLPQAMSSMNSSDVTM
jgi:hypothetical protein